jgi:GT2 family glycosyltransferase
MSASTKGKTVGVMARDRGVPVDVSVVLPTRNRSALLASALRSVVIQQGVRLEIIVVDEASTDDTAAVLGAIGDPRVRVIRHECSLGVSAARNRGAAEGRGDWLAFLDDDDLWAPDKLARQLHTAHATGRDWAYTGAVNITEDGRIAYGNPPLSPDEVVAALRRYNAIPGGGSNVVVRRKTWRQAGPFDSRLRNTEDWEMWIRLARQGVPACVSSPLVGSRVHGANSSLGRQADRGAPPHERRLGSPAPLDGRVVLAPGTTACGVWRIVQSGGTRAGTRCHVRSLRYGPPPCRSVHWR